MFHCGNVNIPTSMPSGGLRKNMNQISILGKLFKRHKTASEQDYYVHGSGLIRIPVARLNEIPKVIQEFHEREAARTRLEGIARH